MKAKWIPGYENRYSINKKGEVFSFIRYPQGRMLKNNVSSSRGYERVNLIDFEGNSKTKEIHRLVILTFYPNLPNKYVVDHIDGNKLNNNFNNLRITNYFGNAQNSRKPNTRKFTSKYKGVSFNGSSWIAQITINKIATYIGSYKNEEQAANAYNELAITHYGDFAVLNDVKKLTDVKSKTHKKEIICTTNGITYPSVTEAAKQLNVNPSNICAVLKGKRNHTKGYRFIGGNNG